VAAIEVQTFDESELEPLPLDDDLEIPRIRLTMGQPPPYHELKVGNQAYRYERSYPIKGHGATLPKFVREQLVAGKQTLVVERRERFLVYLSI
jgi:hypothetical protein